MKDMRKEKDRIVRFIREFIAEEQKDGFVIGISGGIDSAVTAYLLVEAVGKEKILALYMPEKDTAPETRADAMLVIDTLGLKYEIRSITRPLKAFGTYHIMPLGALVFRKLKEKAVLDYYKQYQEKFGESPFYSLKRRITEKADWFYKGIAYHRIKPRVRLAMMFMEAELINYAVAGTDNLTETSIGFYARFGDDCADIVPCGHLYKTEVWDLAAILGVPERIIAKKPSPDVLPGLEDEFALGVDYRTLDKILVQFHAGVKPEKIKEVDTVFAKTLYEQFLWVKRWSGHPIELERDEK